MKIYVQHGDSLWLYSQLFELPLQLLIDSNRQINAKALQIGQTVQIPGYRLQSYTVKAGDSLWAIEQRLGVKHNQLMHLNPGVSVYGLPIGLLLQLPIAVSTMVVNTNRPYTYGALNEDIARLAELYPFMQLEQAATSVMGKEIIALSIGSGPKRVHMNGSIHANEWITTPVLVRFLNEYALALTSGTDIRGLNMRQWYAAATMYVIPMLNPDGVDLVIEGPPDEEPYRSNVLQINDGNEIFSGWKANIRGVDLNKQFPALWERDAVQGPQQPAPRDYSGTAPLTEPEVQGLAEFTRRKDFAHVLAFHTQGKVIYWGFEQLEPPEAETMANEFARVSGYSAVRYVDSTAGYKDWFIQNWRRPGFTIELGEGVNPLPLSQFEEIYEAALGIMLAALYE